MLGLIHSRLRLAPAALVRRLPRTLPSGFMFGTMWNTARFEQAARNRIGAVEQALEHAFDEPLGHRFAGMLAGDDPDRLLCAVAGGRR